MKRNTVKDIREAFRDKAWNDDHRGNGTIELQNVMFNANEPVIFGVPNQKYIDAEIKWYETKDRSVATLYEIYGKEVKIWESCKNNYGAVNSNYGDCILRKSVVSNDSQYGHVLKELARDQLTRKAVMYYAPQYIHMTSVEDGMNDHICTSSVQYFINPREGTRPTLDAQVNMRSNDAVFGYMNDIAWQQHMLEKLSWDLLLHHDIDTCSGYITWCAGSLHIYERHYHLIS